MRDIARIRDIARMPAVAACPRHGRPAASCSSPPAPAPLPVPRDGQRRERSAPARRAPPAPGRPLPPRDSDSATWPSERGRHLWTTSPTTARHRHATWSGTKTSPPASAVRSCATYTRALEQRGGSAVRSSPPGAAGRDRRRLLVPRAPHGDPPGELRAAGRIVRHRRRIGDHHHAARVGAPRARPPRARVGARWHAHDEGGRARVHGVDGLRPLAARRHGPLRQAHRRRRVLRRALRTGPDTPRVRGADHDRDDPAPRGAARPPRAGRSRRGGEGACGTRRVRRHRSGGARARAPCARRRADRSRRAGAARRSGGPAESRGVGRRARRERTHPGARSGVPRGSRSRAGVRCFACTRRSGCSRTVTASTRRRVCSATPNRPRSSPRSVACSARRPDSSTRRRRARRRTATTWRTPFDRPGPGRATPGANPSTGVLRASGLGRPERPTRRSRRTDARDASGAAPRSTRVRRGGTRRGCPDRRMPCPVLLIADTRPASYPVEAR